MSITTRLYSNMLFWCEKLPSLLQKFSFLFQKRKMLKLNLLLNWYLKHTTKVF